MKRTEAGNNLIREKVKNLQNKIHGKYTNDEFEQIVIIALEWSGYKSMALSDGSRGIINGNQKLAMLVDVLGEILVKDK